MIVPKDVERKIRAENRDDETYANTMRRLFGLPQKDYQKRKGVWVTQFRNKERYEQVIVLIGENVNDPDRNRVIHNALVARSRWEKKSGQEWLHEYTRDSLIFTRMK